MEMMRRQVARDWIKDVLMDRILDGFYQPGERLIELKIAKELNCSQGPVREALRDLEGLGLVEHERYRGTRVRCLSKQEMIDAYEIRTVLEELAAQLAAPNLKGNTASLKKEFDLLAKAAKVKNMFERIILWIDPTRDVSIKQQAFEPTGDYRTALYKNIKMNEKVPEDVFKLKTTPKTKTVRPQ